METRITLTIIDKKNLSLLAREINWMETNIWHPNLQIFHLSLLAREINWMETCFY